MSDLRCPVCSSKFNEVIKSGVLIDVCSQCRGVWLDRGELDKLLTLARSQDDDDERGALDNRRPDRPFEDRERSRPVERPVERDVRYDRDDDRDKYRERKYDDDDKYRYKKKKRNDFFDIFDFD